MKNKEFYFIKDDKKIGPVSFYELIKAGPTDETYIWYDGLVDWTKLDQLTELNGLIKGKILPPPLPIKQQPIINKTEIKGEFIIKKDKKEKPNFASYKPSTDKIIFISIWVSFHLFALITSTSEMDFASSDKPDASKFWPFVKFTESKWGGSVPSYIIDPDGDGCASQNDWNSVMSQKNFNGIFYNYDITEFLVYVIGAFIILFIIEIKEYNNKILNEKPR